jgi:pilus assembly protein CpaF
MRPDRLVVGEVRSSELLTLLEALNTGHSGAGSTIHSNSLDAVPSRLELLAFRSGVSAMQLAKLVFSAITWVVHLENQRVTSIGKFAKQETLEVQHVWP